ncbi:glycosyl hydrolases family 31-domain-containing protein [Mycena olivaceomarginata]|nr:glycosyl hydrolases family 31-domain-containing protein [Mycena olivaceomarginata]
MTMADLFQRIEDRRDEWNVEVMVAFLEIYNEEIRDLLTNDRGIALGPCFFATRHRCKGGNDFPTLIFIRIEAVDGQHVYFRWVSAANLQNPAQVVAFEHAATTTSESAGKNVQWRDEAGQGDLDAVSVFPADVSSSWSSSTARLPRLHRRGACLSAAQKANGRTRTRGPMIVPASPYRSGRRRATLPRRLGGSYDSLGFNGARRPQPSRLDPGFLKSKTKASALGSLTEDDESSSSPEKPRHHRVLSDVMNHLDNSSGAGNVSKSQDPRPPAKMGNGGSNAALGRSGSGSERAYASDLTLILEVHIPLADGPMAADDVKIVFGNIGELAELSDNVLSGAPLEDPDATDDHIGELFLRYAPELEGPYKQYITRHPSALAHLTALPQTPELTAYYQKTRDLAVSLSHAWDLQSLLIKPAQRLLKYSLLLTAIIDATALTHPDRPHLVNARTAMEDVARQVNEGRRRAEIVKEVLTAPKKPPTLLRINFRAPVGDPNSDAARADRMAAELARIDVFAQQLARTAQNGPAPPTPPHSRSSPGPTPSPPPSASPPPCAPRLSTPSSRRSRTASPPSPRVSCLRSQRTCWPRWRASSRARPNRASSSRACGARAAAPPPPHHAFVREEPPPARFAFRIRALRTQLPAELPAYLALLHRGLSALVRRLAGLQAGFFGEARDAWAGLWDMLRVEGERNGGGEETVGVWRARWGDVDNGVAGLQICRPLRGSSTLGPAAAQLTPAEAVARAYSEPAPINTESSSSPSSLCGEYSYRDSSNSGGGHTRDHSTSRNNRDSSGASVHTNTSSTSSGKAAHVSNVLAALDPGLGSRRAPAHSNSMSSGYTSTSGGYGAASSSYATSMTSGSPPPPTISGPFSLGSITGKPKGAGDGYSGTGASSSYAPSAYSYSPGAGAAPYSPGGERAGFAGWNENGSTGRGKSPARDASANESSAASWALIAEPKISQDITWTAGKKDIRAKYGNNEVVVAFEPLTVSLLRGGKPQVVLNGRGLLHMEHFRNKKVEETKTEEAAPSPEEGAEDAAEQIVLQAEAEPELNPRAWFEGETEDDWWEERFSTWTDSKPKGPESLSIDISFPSHGTIYGIPQHATRLALPTTAGDPPTFTDPYRLYNADVFEYLASSPMSLYGSIPVLYAHSTWIDVSHASDKSTETHWISESGILDLFLMPGPTPADIFVQYSRLTGTPVLPPHWSLGYHQCRWNYISSENIRTVQKRFDEEDMPVDVFWLDIEYVDEHKYFMWDEKNFLDPVEMTNDVAANGGEEASDRKVLVKQPNGESEYEGWCWSGSSSWIDFFDPNSWDWWKALFKTTALKSGWSWTSSTMDIHIWNDMNEPSVFNGPEISIPRDNIHYGGWEHRDVHNINGMLFLIRLQSNSTSKAVQERIDPPQRPFVLTRSFFAGSQRFGAMWTGDNLGTWEHTAVGVQMVLANGIAGMSFAGSDVGGFFGNPEPEMLIRWYQVGIFNPFLCGESARTRTSTPSGASRSSSSSQYLASPIHHAARVVHTAFRETSVTGVPVLRPHYVVFPKDLKGFAVDDQYFIGASGILVKPITTKGETETTVYLAEDEVYYDYFSHHAYRGATKGKEISVKAELHQVPVFVRGGSIMPTRERPRRSSPLMKLDPFTLRVALSKAGSARGELHLDDGVTHSHEKGQFVWREFAAQTTKKTIIFNDSPVFLQFVDDGSEPGNLGVIAFQLGW